MTWNSGRGTIPAIIAVVLFIAGLVGVTAIGDSIELSTGAWIPTLLLIVGFIAAFVFVMVFVMVSAAAKANRKNTED
jgi:hypothetical protein